MPASIRRLDPLGVALEPTLPASTTKREGNMSERRLALFLTTSKQAVAINPDAVQCIYYGPPRIRIDGAVQICFRDGSEVTVKGDIDLVAKRLGIELFQRGQDPASSADGAAANGRTGREQNLRTALRTGTIWP
jgi:hypothetical protein